MNESTKIPTGDLTIFMTLSLEMMKAWLKHPIRRSLSVEKPTDSNTKKSQKCQIFNFKDGGRSCREFEMGRVEH